MKFFYYLYYKIYNFFFLISDDQINEWKPLIVILTLQVFIIVQIFVWYTITTDRIVNISNPLIFYSPFCLGLAILDYSFFLRRDSWKKHIHEFAGYSSRNKFIGGLAVILIILLITGSLIYSFYRLSLHSPEYYHKTSTLLTIPE